VGSAPLPPHERPWRHPSELAPPDHEPSTGAGRLLIVTTATFGLILVALLAVAVTPSSTTSTASTEDAPPTVVAVRAVPATLVRFGAESAPPMAAPVGSQGLALTTSAAVRDADGTLAVQLASGRVVEAAVMSIDDDGDLAVVSLPDVVPTETFVVPRDAEAPVPSDTVKVHAETPVVVAVEALGALEVGEGTPVTDDDGHLVGLCSRDEAGDETTLTGVAISPDELVDASAGSD
jgi:hypothetical protein